MCRAIACARVPSKSWYHSILLWVLPSLIHHCNPTTLTRRSLVLVSRSPFHPFEQTRPRLRPRRGTVRPSLIVEFKTLSTPISFKMRPMRFVRHCAYVHQTATPPLTRVYAPKPSLAHQPIDALILEYRNEIVESYSSYSLVPSPTCLTSQRRFIRPSRCLRMFLLLLLLYSHVLLESYSHSITHQTSIYLDRAQGTQVCSWRDGAVVLLHLHPGLC